MPSPRSIRIFLLLEAIAFYTAALVHFGVIALGFEELFRLLLLTHTVSKLKEKRLFASSAEETMTLDVCKKSKNVR